MNWFSILAAATLAVSGLTFVGCDKETTRDTTTPSDTRTADRPADDDTVAEKTERAAERTGDAIADAARNTKEAAKDAGGAVADATRKAGDKLGEAAGDARQAAGRIGDRGTAAAPDAEGVRDVLASVTEAALTKDGLDDLTERLVDADRNRIGDAIDEESAEHTALVTQFRADWKAKYGQDFDIKEDKAFSDSMFTIAQGEIGEAAPTGAEIATGQKAGDLDTNKEEGRNVAVVQVAESHGMPALTVPLIHELPDAWRIDVPDTITAAKLRSNVIAHLQAAHGMKDQWPANVDDAYAAVTHHVLMAVLDKPVQQE